MAKKDNISSSVIQRLPRYYRFLNELDKEGITHVNSGELARRMRSTASQVRQDFNCFGEFGQQGIGYSVKSLTKEIENILGIKNRYPAILIGAGNIGTAIANHLTFENRCFKLIGIFDNDENKIGSDVAD
ncbi:MAG: redox-sensing transcriptional repressor Rex, partial [Clostridia bacterium]|nr:redox-sensing transcriptional repressor Rex [Clostridia bacterium]